MPLPPAHFHHTLFWESLATSGVLAKRLVEELRSRWTPEAWRPMGEVMVREGLLTVRQASGLLAMQAKEPSMRFGELAVRESLCSNAELEGALELQRRICPGPIEILLEDERVRGEDLVAALLRYVRFLEGRLQLSGS
ncbi:MAG: hypothetical protein P1V81_04330 [Planctomycetota bacterium]|nr:hypothetical protein [Planctomycetota bacterium]